MGESKYITKFVMFKEFFFIISGVTCLVFLIEIFEEMDSSIFFFTGCKLFTVTIGLETPSQDDRMMLKT